MTTMILVTPYLAFVCGVAMMAGALHLWEQEPREAHPQGGWRKHLLTVAALLAVPTFAQAQVDLRTATESGNAIIMGQLNGGLELSPW
jgi:hypothetical protein